MTDMRQFQFSFADLIDQLTIDQIKEVLLSEEQAKKIISEIEQLEHDIGTLLHNKNIGLKAEFIRMVILLSQINLHVWYNKDEMMSEPDNYIELLRFSQDLNSMRNHIKNLIMAAIDEATPANKRSTFFSDNSSWYVQILANLRNGK
ncbi:MAG: hypothetical protein NTZ85_05550 [Bacteroidia bacterium]|nr:hypothetical protein [Bacteroidia bacterium]